MNKCHTFFLVFSNCIFLSIQVPIPQSDERTPTIPFFINYGQEGLKLIGITTAPGCTVDYKEAFSKIAPVAIRALQDAKQNSIDANRNSIDANWNSIDAGRYNFILYSRKTLVFMEDHYCFEMPEDDDIFLQKIKEDERFKDIPNEKISCKKHAKIWLWMLVKEPAISIQLQNLRQRLNNNANEFLWFVTQVQKFFDVFNDDTRSPPSSLLDPKLDIDKFGTYLAFLNPEVQKALKVYYRSDGKKVD